MPDITYRTGTAELLPVVASMLKKLHDHHVTVSPNFATFFAPFSYERRTGVCLRKAEKGALLVEVARDAGRGRDVGFCVSTIVSKETRLVGEIDSLYVEPDYRRQGIADRMLRDALAWMEEAKVDAKIVVIAYGNDQAVQFYERYGFRPKSTKLEMIPEGN